MSVKSTIRYLFVSCCYYVTSFFFVRPLLYKNKIFRHLIYNSINYNARTLIYSNIGSERYITDSRDQIIGRTLYLSGEYDFDKFLNALDIMRKHHRDFGIVELLVDIGANIGPICVPAVARGYCARAIAIEPDAHNCRMLRANVALNGLAEKILIHECALGMRDGERVQLELGDYNLGDHRVRVNDGPGMYNEDKRQAIEVASRSLDTLCPFDRDVKALVWMDVQGYEGHVLAGGKEWCDARVPFGLEFWPYALRRAGSFQLLKDALSGYRGFYDLRYPSKFCPIEKLDDLYDELSGPDGTTDILVIGRPEGSEMELDGTVFAAADVRQICR